MSKLAPKPKPTFRLAKTKTALDAVAKPGRYSFDGHAGLLLNVRGHGSKTWLFRSRVGGVQRIETLGAFPELTFDKAAGIAAERRISSGDGVNPVSAVREAIADRLASDARERRKPTFADFAPQCLADFAASGKRSVKAQRHTLARIPASFAALQLAKITRLDVAELLNSFAAPSAKRHVLALIRVILSKSGKRGLIGANPAIGADAPAVGKRSRTLTDDELRTLWDAVPSGVRAGTLDALRMQLATAQRISEVLALRWSDIANGAWLIPAHIAKNGREHYLPLSKLALQIIERQPTDHALVFAPLRGDSPMLAGSLGSVLELVRTHAGLGHFTTHDLRRTAATRIAGLGVSPHVLEAILNHKSGTISGVSAIYNRHQYSNEKAAALALWGAELQRIVGLDSQLASNVTQFRKVS